ncbi:MAG TPA: flagellar protein FliS [Stellaceae bacterium]|nr:flagellar protein FliS [Stellaceae bacterium]
MSMNQLSAYRSVDCAGVSSERLMMVALDAVQFFLTRAEAAIDDENRNEKARVLARAGRVMEFMLGLTGVQPGDLSIRLGKLYRFVIEGIVKGNANDDKEAIVSARTVIEDIGKYWRLRFPHADLSVQ